jgi:hypothetical protein
MQILCQDVFVKEERSRYSVSVYSSLSYDGLIRATIISHCGCGMIFFQ